MRSWLKQPCSCLDGKITYRQRQARSSLTYPAFKPNGKAGRCLGPCSARDKNVGVRTSRWQPASAIAGCSLRWSLTRRGRRAGSWKRCSPWGCHLPAPRRILVAPLWGSEGPRLTARDTERREERDHHGSCVTSRPSKSVFAREWGRRKLQTRVQVDRCREQACFHFAL